MLNINIHSSLFAIIKLLCHVSEVDSITSQRQTIQCYNGVDQTGDSVRAKDYIYSISLHNMDNSIRSCCLTGVWILYEDNDYNSYNPAQSSWWGWGDKFCTALPPLFQNKASSLRFTGAPDDWKYDTINFYQIENFIGDEWFAYGDKPVLNEDFPKSLIVTGCSGWTIYEYEHYQGAALCLMPGNKIDCQPGFFISTYNFGILKDRISSVRRGCQTNNIVYPGNYYNGHV